METFTEVPTYATEAEAEQKVLLSNFGDGYQQRAEDGINSKRLRFRVMFNNVTSAKAATIMAFVIARGGKEAFLWTPPAPHDTERQWTIEQPVAHRYVAYDCETIEATFIQDFNPAP